MPIFHRHRSQGNTIFVALMVGAGIIIATLVFGSGVFLERTRQGAIRGATVRLQNSALIVQNTLNRQLLQVDSALASLPPMFAAYLAPGAQLDKESATRLLKSFYFETFAFRDLLIVRPGGSLWAAARPRPGNRSLPFTVHSSSSPRPANVAIQGPFQNQLTGSWSWFVMRQIWLSGIGEVEAVAEVPVPFLLTLLAPIAEVPGLRIEVMRADGALLASLPHDERRIGKAGSPITRMGHAEGVVFRSDLEGAGQTALAVWTHTLYPDVNLALTLDLNVAMADWVRDRDRLVIIVSVAVFLIIGCAVLIFAALKKQQRLEHERRKSREMLDSAIDSMSEGFVMWDERDCLVTCNQQFRDMYDVSAAHIKPGIRFADIVREGVKAGQYPEAGDVETFVRETIEWRAGGAGTLERLLPGNRWVLIRERRIPTGGFVGIRTDITAIKQAAADLTRANERVSDGLFELQQQHDVLVARDHALRTQNMLFDAALNNMSQGLLMVDSDRRVIVCNRRFLDMFRISSQQAQPGTTTAALFTAIGTSGGLGAAAAGRMFDEQESLTTRQRTGAFVISEEDHIALSISQRPLPDGGWVSTYEDVTERHQAEGRIRYMAHHDELTKLPNRVLFRTRLNEALQQLGSTSENLAVLYLDLDRFKYINDTLGHSEGDALLAAAGGRLRKCVRECDFVARLGGDEFAILHSSSDVADSATILAQRVIKTLSEPYRLADGQVEVGASIGIAIATDSTTDGGTLLKNADMALYQAKAINRGTYCVFEPELERRLHARVTIEADLRIALVQNQFEVYYQPIFNLQDDTLSGFEALLRWRHPERGLISPGQFIPLAEESGLIRPIGAWLIRQVCSDLSRLPENIRVAANLSPVQLEDSEVVSTIGAALNEFGVSARRLELEITESALLKNSVATVALLLELSRLGIGIALDDFGTGYSSLSYLRSFPFDKIKIDRLFVSEMTNRADCAAIVSSVVQLASKLGMTTTAEGVETEEQLALVREVGCTSVQGFLLGRPTPFSEILEGFFVTTPELSLLPSELP